MTMERRYLVRIKVIHIHTASVYLPHPFDEDKVPDEVETKGLEIVEDRFHPSDTVDFEFLDYEFVGSE